MIQIPAALAPVFTALFFLVIVGTAVWIIAGAWRSRGTTDVAALAPWRVGFVDQLQMDGRWTRSTGPFSRRMECLLYAPAGRAGETRSMPRVARFSHSTRSVGPWVLEASTRLETDQHEIDLAATNYLELLPQLGLVARSWTVSIDGVAIGSLTRTDGAIVARNTAGDHIGRWVAPSAPGRLRHPAPSDAEARQPWYTPLEILGTRVQLRLPFFDGRQHPYDFASVPFIRGAVPPGAAVEDWALAFIALSGQAALALRIATPRLAATPLASRHGNRTSAML